MIKTNYHIVSILRDCSLPDDVLFYITSFLGLSNYCEQLREMHYRLSHIKTNLFGECFGLFYKIEDKIEERFCIEFGEHLLYWHFRDKMNVSKALLLLLKKRKYIPDSSDDNQLLKESNFQLFDF